MCTHLFVFIRLEPIQSVRHLRDVRWLDSRYQNLRPMHMFGPRSHRAQKRQWRVQRLLLVWEHRQEGDIRAPVCPILSSKLEDKRQSRAGKLVKRDLF